MGPKKVLGAIVVALAFGLTNATVLPIKGTNTSNNPNTVNITNTTIPTASAASETCLETCSAHQVLDFCSAVCASQRITATE